MVLFSLYFFYMRFVRTSPCQYCVRNVRVNNTIIKLSHLLNSMQDSAALCLMPIIISIGSLQQSISAVFFFFVLRLKDVDNSAPFLAHSDP